MLLDEAAAWHSPCGIELAERSPYLVQYRRLDSLIVPPSSSPVPPFPPPRYDSIGRVYDASHGGLAHKFEGHSDWLRATCFADEGRAVLTASDDSTARLWDMETGEYTLAFMQR